MSFKVEGVIPPHITPFTKEGDLDLEALKKCVNFWVESGVSGLTPCGSNGEAPYLTREERMRVIETVLNEVKGRVPVIPGTGGISTRETIQLTKDAEDLGVDAALIVTPFYYKYSDRELIAHYSKILESVDLPILLYNVPKFTGFSIKPEIVAELASEYSNLIGVKNSSGDIAQLSKLINLVGDKISIMAGTADILLPTLLLGGKGGIIAVAIVFPELCVKLYETFKEGNLVKASKLQLQISRINDILVKSRNQLSTIKAALRFRGLPAGYPRLPTLNLEPKDLKKLEIELSSVSQFQKGDVEFWS